NFAFRTKSIIHLQANNPDKKAAIKPTNKGKKSKLKLVDPSAFASKYIFAVAPKIKGNTIKKEKRAAFDLSLPNKIEVEMVDPDLEIPGSNAAKACAIPIIIESL